MRKTMHRTIISLIMAIGCMQTPVFADEVKLQDNAPDRYVVVKGDTLWKISGHFLKQPWRWPEIWQMNKSEIKNPHWIYPGDVVYLDRSGATPRLRLLKNEVLNRNGKLSPQVRESNIDHSATPSVPAYAVAPFLSRPVVIDPETFKNSPRIAAGPDERVIYSVMDQVYTVGLAPDAKVGDVWQVYRNNAKPLIDPDDPDQKKILGYEVTYVGEVRLDVQGDVAVMKVTNSKEEISVGDRLIKANNDTFINFIPRLPAGTVNGRIASVYGGLAEAGTYHTVVVNRGSSDGLEIGNVLFAYKAGRVIKKEDSNEPERKTPLLKAGNLFVYKIFPNMSYALLLDSSQSVQVGDYALSDESGNSRR